MRWVPLVEIAFKCRICGYKDAYTITAGDARWMIEEFKCKKCEGVGGYNGLKCDMCHGCGYVRNYVPCYKCNNSDWELLWIVPFILQINGYVINKIYPFDDEKLIEWFKKNGYPFINVKKKIYELKIEKIIKNKRKLITEKKEKNVIKKRRMLSEFF